MKTHISEAQAEVIVDRRVHARLRTDSAYRNAPDPEIQQQREEDIEAQEWAYVERTYEVD